MPDTRILISAARTCGEAAAQSGAFDQWSFGEVVLPYLAQLRNERDVAISGIRSRATDLTRWDLEVQHRITADAQDMRGRQRLLQEQRSEASAHMQAAWARINHLARLEARLQELRHFVGLDRHEGEQANDGAPSPRGDHPGNPTTAARGDLGTATWDDGAEEPDVAEHALLTLPGGPAADPQSWEGPHAPRISGRWTAAILIGLVLVEIPIQYVIFQFFHGYSLFEEFLTWVFTIPVSAVMVLLPHLSGWWYRARTTTGADRLMRIAPLLLLLPWAYLACQLGYLRARVLLARPSLPIGTSSTSFLKHIPSNAATLHVTPTTMSVLFIALLLGVGGIGFMLGLAREHPLAGAYSGAAAERKAITDQLNDLESPAELAEQQVQASAEQRRLGDQQLTHHLQSIRAAYTAAEHAYLDAIAAATGDPAVSEAAAKMSERVAADASEQSEAAAEVGAQ